jgi:hypothetical protein
MLIIQNLLAIAKSPVCADDLHPVLIYVIIKANPPTFLSNVQYIEGKFFVVQMIDGFYLITISNERILWYSVGV